MYGEPIYRSTGPVVVPDVLVARWVGVADVRRRVVLDCCPSGARGPGSPRSAGAQGRGPRAGRAEAILKERYARGEIDRETYERMLTDVRRSPGG